MIAKKATGINTTTALDSVRRILVIAMLIGTASISLMMLPTVASATGSIASCDACHGYSNAFTDSGGTRDGANGTFPGSHGKHAASYQIQCSTCHGVTNTTYTHRDGNVNIATAGSISSGSYSKATFSQSNTTNLGSCSSVYCHSNGSPLNGAASTVTATWGNAATGACGTCHGVLASSAPTSTLHGQHTAASGGYQLACGYCHAGVVNMTANSTVQATITSTTLHVNNAKNVSFETVTNAGADAYNSKTPANSCTNIYCHSRGTSALGMPYTQPVTTPQWSMNSGALGCNGCHGDTTSTTGKPSYANNSPKSNSHAVHQPSQSCSACHYATTTDNGVSITNKTNHADKSYDVARYGAGGAWTSLINFTYVSQADGGFCNTNQCHAGQNAKWGSIAYNTTNQSGDWDCVTCHSYAFPKRLRGGAISTIRQVVGSSGDFNMSTIPKASRHLFGATKIVKWDCIVCHREGAAFTAGNNTAGNVNWSLHNDTTGLVHLRDVDAANDTTGWAIDNKAWTTNDYTSLDNFCVSCHDENGASAVSVNATDNGFGGNALMPFNSTDHYTAGGLDYLKGSTEFAGSARNRVTNVKSQFYPGTNGPGATYNGNPSQHAVLGKRYSTQFGTWGLNAWSNRVLKKTGVNVNVSRDASLLTCADCHVLDTGSGAHGGKFAYNMWSTTAGALCWNCHSSATYMPGGTSGTGSRISHSSIDTNLNTASSYGIPSGGATGCFHCHASWDGTSTVTRQASYGGIHGSWSSTAVYWTTSTATRNRTAYRFFPGAHFRLNPGSTDAAWNSGAGTAGNCYFNATGSFTACTSHAGRVGNLSSNFNYNRPTKY